MKNEKNKKKRLLPILAVAVLGVATLSGCSTQESDAKWWNPLTWNWDALAFWKDKTPDVSEDVDPDGEGEEQNQEPQGRAKNLEIQISKAFGEFGKQTLTVTVTPANADIDLSFSSNKSSVIVTKTAAKTADVYVTTYFAGNATITVTDAISGISGTGKVYSYGKTTLQEKTSLAHGKTGAFVVSDNANTATTTGVISIEKDLTFATQSATAFNEFGVYNPLSWVQSKSTIYIHVAYNGSFAPGVVNQTDASKKYTKVGDVAADPGQKTAVITVQLIAGLNNIQIRGASGNGEILAAFSVQNAQSVQNITVPDITFNE